MGHIHLADSEHKGMSLIDYVALLETSSASIPRTPAPKVQKTTTISTVAPKIIVPSGTFLDAKTIPPSGVGFDVLRKIGSQHLRK